MNTVSAITSETPPRIQGSAIIYPVAWNEMPSTTMNERQSENPRCAAQTLSVAGLVDSLARSTPAGYV